MTRLFQLGEGACKAVPSKPWLHSIFNANPPGAVEASNSLTEFLKLANIKLFGVSSPGYEDHFELAYRPNLVSGVVSLQPHSHRRMILSVRLFELGKLSNGI